LFFLSIVIPQASEGVFPSNDPRLRKLCLIKTSEAAYLRSVLSRSIRRVGEDDLTRIIEEKVVNVSKGNNAGEVDILFDASFIKA
jgi:hypothetical protein